MAVTPVVSPTSCIVLVGSHVFNFERIIYVSPNYTVPADGSSHAGQTAADVWVEGRRGKVTVYGTDTTNLRTALNKFTNITAF